VGKGAQVSCGEDRVLGLSLLLGRSQPRPELGTLLPSPTDPPLLQSPPQGQGSLLDDVALDSPSTRVRRRRRRLQRSRSRIGDRIENPTLGTPSSPQEPSTQTSTLPTYERSSSWIVLKLRFLSSRLLSWVRGRVGGSRAQPMEPDSLVVPTPSLPLDPRPASGSDDEGSRGPGSLVS
jgi:hypothetical protein